MVCSNDSGDDPANRSINRLEALKQFYATVLCQAFSPDGQYLIVSLKNGKLSLFNLNKIFDSHESSTSSDKIVYQPINSFQAHKDAIYGMTSNNNFVYTGGKGEIKCWNWTDLINQNSPEPQWSFTLSQRDSILHPEINCLLLSGSDDTLYAGCGNNIYCLDLESNRPKYIIQGHSDYINCLTYSESMNTLFSGSEDGTIKMWDTRNSNQLNTIEPHKDSQLNRPSGKWIGSIALDNSSEWMVCGGGPHLSIWHLRSLSRGIIFDDANVSSQVAHIHNDFVISGGSSPKVSTWTLNGKVYSEIPCEPFHIYSIAIHDVGQKSLMAIGGSSHKINICTNFKFNDFHLEAF